MKTFRPFIVIALAGFTLYSCGLFPPARTGDISIQLGFPTEASAQEKDLLPATADTIGIAPGPQKAFDPASVAIRLTVSGEDMEPIVVERAYNRESGPIYMKAEGIPVGERFLTLEALNGNGGILTYGQSAVFVAGGKNNIALVNMVPFEPPQIWPGEGAPGLINPGMRDFFYVEIVTPGTYFITLLLGGVQSNLFTLYDATGAKIQLPASSLDVESATYGQTPELISGIYYLSVTSPYPLNAGGERSYSINIYDPAYNPQ